MFNRLTLTLVAALVLALGTLYIVWGKYSDARAEVAHLTDLRARDARAQATLTESLTKEKKRHDGAVRAADKALKENPQYESTIIPDSVADALRM